MSQLEMKRQSSTPNHIFWTDSSMVDDILCCGVLVLEYAVWVGWQSHRLDSSFYDVVHSMHIKGDQSYLLHVTAKAALLNAVLVSLYKRIIPKVCKTTEQLQRSMMVELRKM